MWRTSLQNPGSPPEPGFRRRPPVVSAVGDDRWSGDGAASARERAAEPPVELGPQPAQASVECEQQPTQPSVALRQEPPQPSVALGQDPAQPSVEPERVRYVGFGGPRCRARQRRSWVHREAEGAAGVKTPVSSGRGAEVRSGAGGGTEGAEENHEQPLPFSQATGERVVQSSLSKRLQEPGGEHVAQRITGAESTTRGLQRGPQHGFYAMGPRSMSAMERFDAGVWGDVHGVLTRRYNTASCEDNHGAAGAGAPAGRSLHAAPTRLTAPPRARA